MFYLEDFWCQASLLNISNMFLIKLNDTNKWSPRLRLGITFQS